MNGPWLDIVLVFVFILIGGVFAATELALVSLREGQARALSARGRRGERVARLVEDPNRFLAAVQVGVTLAGFLSAAFGAARLAVPVSDLLEGLGLTVAASDTVALVLVTLVISYFSLVFSELAPKRLALQRPEGISMAFAPALDRIATLSRPVIWLLSKSTDLVVRMLGGDPMSQRETITEEELRDMVAAHESLTKDERKLIDDVFAAGERQLREVMLPRTEVAFLDAGMTLSRALKETSDQPHSRYPVAGTSQDDVIGFLHVRDLMVPASNARGLRVADVVREVKMLPASKRVLPAMSEMRREGHHMAIVVDEYGGTAGIVTLEDLIEEVIGDIRDEYDVDEGDPLEFRGGEVEADGLLHLDEVRTVTGVSLPEGPYETLAGFVMATLGHVPRQGEAVEVDGHRLEVSELDGRRISRVRVTPLESPELEESA
ncbi:MAG: Hemolysins and related proteins containing CBS domains [uncultured Frankineae bacterium]|uniref:Hemolysins and related proteins containing CBS domains n=1 Tax=uncultured Frankineae bacterium TaxID=437475 RepID=A0A6J4L0E5_9ACTN|nr:MAG: Hemolysins and related proteins containing CBS domains [uncultured Frankineae bacterium]